MSLIGVDRYGNHDHDEMLSRMITQEHLRARYSHLEWDGDVQEYKETELITPAYGDDPAFIWTARYRPGYASANVSIEDTNLKKLLASELKGYPGHWQGEQMIFQWPFFPLLHKLKPLLDVVNNTCTEGSEELKSLLELVQYNPPASNFHRYFRRLEDNLIAYNHLFMIFPPGQLVYATPFKESQIFKVAQGSYEIAGNSVYYELRCWIYDFNGRMFTRCPFRLHLDRFNGTRAINSLPFYPLKFHPDKLVIRDLCKKRGTVFRICHASLKGEQVFDYDGEAIYTEFQEGIGGGNGVKFSLATSVQEELPVDATDEQPQKFNTFHYKGPIIADPVSYDLYVGNLMSKKTPKDRRPKEWQECDCEICLRNRTLCRQLGTCYDDCGPYSKNWLDFDEVQLLMCPPRLKGFAWNKRLWVQLHVDNVLGKPGKRNSYIFDRLTIPRDHNNQTKKLILSLVESHISKPGGSEAGIPDRLTDLVEGKGRGLVILLHGASGAGKTLTAESIADHVGRQLLKISVADFGIDLAKVEQKLTTIFHLAKQWGAILLLDEADVLLESRKIDGNLKRHLLVSVFLKVLEYHEGILFLTTNRVQSLDKSISSRVHLAVHFPDLLQEDKKRIFRLLFDRINEDAKESKEILDWLDSKNISEDFDGRQIRNILSSAVDLARVQRSKLRLSHVERLWQTTDYFQQDLPRS